MAQLRGVQFSWIGSLRIMRLPPWPPQGISTPLRAAPALIADMLYSVHSLLRWRVMAENGQLRALQVGHWLSRPQRDTAHSFVQQQVRSRKQPARQTA